jgi:DNA polymerase
VQGELGKKILYRVTPGLPPRSLQHLSFTNMPEHSEELNNLLIDVHRYLNQQRELYGNIIFQPEKGSESVLAETIMPEPMSKPTKQIVPLVETTLFGDTSVAAPTNVSEPRQGEPVEPKAAYPREPWTNATTLSALNEQICTCLKCGLGHTRKNFVFGVGNPTADVVVIGEAPGADEDAQGEPFVGRAGQLLNKILEAVHFKREEVFICNILKCRPPENRRPTPEETELCEPYLWRQLEIIKPKMILVLGLTAAQTLLKTNLSLGQMRGKFMDYRGIKLMVTYHPAALLRNPNWKKPTWEDVQLFRKTYDEMKSR